MGTLIYVFAFTTIFLSEFVSFHCATPSRVAQNTPLCAHAPHLISSRSRTTRKIIHHLHLTE